MSYRVFSPFGYNSTTFAPSAPGAFAGQLVFNLEPTNPDDGGDDPGGGSTEGSPS